jgi:NAD(P)-dependent dehydrogenase (short-subunit alcohol dehydrogenase family)
VTDKAALVTGGSSGIGLAIARALGEDGYGVTVSARRPEKLEAAAEELRSAGIDVLHHPTNMTDEEGIAELLTAHKERFGRLDVLVNNAGVGIGQPMAELGTKQVDMQLDVNLRAVILTTRESVPMLREAAAEHRKALIVNTASIAGKAGQGWLSVYSATKAAVIGFSQASQSELASDGIQVTALCPGFVDTPMTEFVKEHVAAEEMIQPEDIAEAVRLLLRTSRNCLIPEIVFMRPSELLGMSTP